MGQCDINQDNNEDKPRIRESQFPNVPPYHNFLPYWEQYSRPICPALREEEWMFPAQIMPVVRDVVEHAGFKVIKGTLRCDDEKSIIMNGFIWDNLPLVEKSIDAIDFTRLKQGVKINKFPGFIDLNRKDLLWKNFSRMQDKFGSGHFGFHPDTYRLPQEQDELVKRMKRENFSRLYIIKMPNSFCGIGAMMLKHPKNIPHKIKEHKEERKIVKKEDPIIVQSYISNPYLIRGYKFDFRIYVLVTSINPLRIYLFKNGLVRFATEKFTTDPEQLSNMYIHLTNFSVNKKGDVPNDYPDGCQVNKWTIYELWEYMRDVDGVDPTPFWDGVKDVVIKTLLCGHENIDKLIKSTSSSFYNNFNLLGLDIFIDEDLNPYLLEVNTIPSLFINQVSKEVDTNLKAPLVAEVFNICGHHISSGLAAKHKSDIISAHLPEFVGTHVGYDHRMYCNVTTEQELQKQKRVCRAFYKTDRCDSPSSSDDTGNNEDSYEERSSPSKSDENENEAEAQSESEMDEYEDEYSEYETESESDSDKVSNQKKETAFENSNIPSDILDDLTPCDIRVLVHSEEELSQTRTFERIFPRDDTCPYLDLMPSHNYYDVLLAAWEQRHGGGDGGRREEGLQRLRGLTQQKRHLEVPKSESRMKMPTVTPVTYRRNLIVPHIFNK